MLTCCASQELLKLPCATTQHNLCSSTQHPQLNASHTTHATRATQATILDFTKLKATCQSVPISQISDVLVWHICCFTHLNASSLPIHIYETQDFPPQQWPWGRHASRRALERTTWPASKEISPPRSWPLKLRGRPWCSGRQQSRSERDGCSQKSQSEKIGKASSRFFSEECLEKA